jgi:hypothetical protein
MCEGLSVLSHGSPMALAHLVLVQASVTVGASYLLLLDATDCSGWVIPTWSSCTRSSN